MCLDCSEVELYILNKSNGGVRSGNKMEKGRVETTKGLSFMSAGKD